MKPVILFVFAGRKPNMALQVPLIKRILADNPNADYHIWDLARNPDDSDYLRSIEGERISVITDFAGDNPWTRFNDVFCHYAAEKYRDHLFMKIDDDVVFLETDRFRDFIQAVDDNRSAVVSAKVINNGACTVIDPGLYELFRAMSFPLLDVHQSAEYARMAHNYLFDHAVELLGEPLQLIPTADWLSINLIGYDWHMGCRIASHLGKPSPQYIAGRRFRRGVIGDEGRVNMLPRMILQGFLAGHLYFGPQAKAMGDAELDAFRSRYAELGKQHRDATDEGARAAYAVEKPRWAELADRLT